MRRTALLAVIAAVIGAASPAGADDRARIARMLARFERGDYDDEDAFLALRKDETIPILLARLKHPRADARLTALDLLLRIDLHDDMVLNTPSIVEAMIQVLESPEPDVAVTDEALRALRWVPVGPGSPRMITALLAQLRNGRARAGYVLGAVGDSSLIPVLEPFLQSRDRGQAVVVTRALAKLGHAPSLARIVADLDEEGPKREQAMEALAYVDNPATVPAIARFLDDPGAPVSEARDVGHLPYRYTAVGALSEIVDDPPAKRQSWQVSDADVAAWKAWWLAHRDEYERGSPPDAPATAQRR